jgi:hypothetical protein
MYVIILCTQNKYLNENSYLKLKMPCLNAIERSNWLC